MDKTARRASPWAPIGLSAVTCLVLVSGHLDVAGQVLLVSGLYALWCWLDAYRGRWFKWQARRAALALTFGWLLGFLLAAPYLLPVLEYTHTGARMALRSAGAEERPPVGIAALPQTVLPDMYGAMMGGNARFGGDNQIESSAATYTGVLATLLVAPLAWCSRRHRSLNVFWICLAFLALSWCLNIPGFVHLLRLPGLNMMSHNRLVFAASFAVLALTAVGLEALSQGSVRWQRWFWAPVGVLAALCLWSIYRTAFLPEELKTTLPQSILAGKQIDWVRDLAGVQRAQAGYAERFTAAAVLCGAGIAGWLFLRLRPWNTRLLALLGAALVGDLLWFAYGRNVQCDPALYYPRIPVLEDVAKAAPGRILGFGCLPSQLCTICGLRDIRGYDGVDPARMVELLRTSEDPAAKVNEVRDNAMASPQNDFHARGSPSAPAGPGHAGRALHDFSRCSAAADPSGFSGTGLLGSGELQRPGPGVYSSPGGTGGREQGPVGEAGVATVRPARGRLCRAAGESAWPVPGQSGHCQRDSDPCDAGFAHGNTGPRRPGGPMGQRLAGQFERQAPRPSCAPTTPSAAWSCPQARGRWSSGMPQPVLPGG